MRNLEGSCLLKAAVANAGRRESRELLEFLKQRTLGVEFGVDQLRQNRGAASALDWYAVIDSRVDLESIAAALWAAYAEFVRDEPEREDECGFLFVHVKNRRREAIQYCLRHGHDDEAEFVEEFSRHLRALMRPATEQRPRELIHGMVTRPF